MTAKLASVVLNCADPVKLAEFYRVLTGWPVAGSDDDFAALGEDSVQIAFQRVEGHHRPDWPGTGQQAHLDFQVADPEATVRDMLALGASRPDFQPGGASWTVLIDPEGHPFCVMAL